MVSKGVAKVPTVGSALEIATSITASQLENMDYQSIQEKLTIFSDCGNVFDQCEIAGKVARQVTDRYQEQLLRLLDENEQVIVGCCAKCIS
ncbi:unnamed protein product, partial [Rotaria sp. Silwood2]